MYIKTIVYAYRKNWNTLNSEKYDAFIEELNLISKDLWFFDNDPTSMDIERSESNKYVLKSQGKNAPTETLYYDDPLRRNTKEN